MSDKRSSFLRILILVATAVACVETGPVFGQGRGGRKGKSLAPYVPSPMPVVHKMLEVAEITTDDVVYDLGCGDGRIVVEAAKTYGARGVGVDFDPKRVADAKARAAEHGVADRVTIIHEDAMAVDLTAATVVTIYLFPEANERLKPRFQNMLPPGTRVVSHDFRLRGWTPVREVNVKEEGSYSHTVYAYRTPGGESLSGTWTWAVAGRNGPRQYAMHVRADGAEIAGRVTAPEIPHGLPLLDARRDGTGFAGRVEHRDGDAAVRASFQAELEGDRLVGKWEVDFGHRADAVAWTGRRRAVNVDGEWRVTFDGATPKPHPDTLTLRRTSKGIEGAYRFGDGREVPIRPTMTGSRMAFEVVGPLADRPGRRRFKGWLEGDAITGTTRVGSDPGPSGRWQAVRRTPGGKS